MGVGVRQTGGPWRAIHCLPAPPCLQRPPPPRFWKGGFWLNHLNGKPYHISALYVIDLQRFRKQAAGDNYRQVPARHTL